MRGAFMVLLSACDVAGVPCVGDLDEVCSREGVYCVRAFDEAADAATYCGAPRVSNARASINTCAGYRVVVMTVSGSTVWYYYDRDGGLAGASRRGEDFKHECLGGVRTFLLPNDCASSTERCCSFDFTKELACGARDGGAD